MAVGFHSIIPIVIVQIAPRESYELLFRGGLLHDV